MRARILFGFIICLLVGLVDSAARAVEPKGAVAAVDVRSAVDRSVNALTVKIKASKNLKSIWKDFSKVESDAKVLRKKEKRQSEPDEIHLDSLLASLNEIPRENKFVKSNCATLKNQIIAEYSPNPKEDGEMPEFVTLTMGVLDALCAK